MQRLLDSAERKLLFLRGRYDEAIHLVADLAVGKDIVQGGGGATTPR